MAAFYREWTAGAETQTALARAQAEMKKTEKWKDPHDWAAWVLWGLPD